MATKKISNEPAFMLHRYDWSETSLILEVLTRHHGRIALVAKGVKRPSSQFRPILLPFQPLLISFGGDTEVRTLKGAEWTGGYTMPSGDALLTGYYLNELLMKLLARDDPHELLFDAYASMTELLRETPNPQSALRAFELIVLREIGLLPSLDASSLTLQGLKSGVRYTLQPEAGLREAHDAQDNAAYGANQPASAPASLSATTWLALQTALDNHAPQHALREVCATLAAPERNALKTQLRSLLHFHCGGKTLRTRQLMLDVQSL